VPWLAGNHHGRASCNRFIRSAKYQPPNGIGTAFASRCASSQTTDYRSFFRAQTEPTMELNSLRDLYIEELKDLYSAENQLVKALPKMAKAATAKSLKNGFEKHLKETREHVNRLKTVFADMKVSPGNKKCKAMQGLIEEGEHVIEEEAEAEVRDAALIAAAQRVEHYEIAGYGCVRTYAQLLGDKQAAKSLQKTLDEEGATDKKLTQLAQRINVKAEDPPQIGKRILEAVGAE
jgi:ferritin-like metal-binding protein YciE